jgi:tetratricopeptide (TPR) repeat protein
MTSSLDELLARSLALGDRLGVDESLEINQAILELDPANEIAATRLGIGLLNAERPEEAIPVFEAALRAHPENAFAEKRLQQARRDLASSGVKAPRRRKRARIAREVWVKAMDYKEGWTAAAPGQLTWVSDAGIIDQHGRRKFRDNGQPWGEPSWRLGDPVGLYFGDTDKIPMLVEVAARPSFDPAFVASESGSAEAGERWPWVTEVRVINALPLDSAPSLEELNIPAGSMQRRTRKLLDATQSAILLGRYGRK